VVNLYRAPLTAARSSQAFLSVSQTRELSQNGRNCPDIYTIRKII